MPYDHLVDENRLDAIVRLIETIVGNLPEGFEKVEEYGGISYVVPHAIFPAGYHVTPEKPLPFLSAKKAYMPLPYRHLCRPRAFGMV